MGYGVESVRSWVRQADIDDGVKEGAKLVVDGRNFLDPAIMTSFVQHLDQVGFDAVAFTEHPAPSKKWLDAGFCFVAIGTDNGVLVKAVDELRARFR